MNKPNVEIKNFKTHYSREWGPNGAFECDLWINGIKCCHVNDDGNGGCYDYVLYDYNNPKAKEIKANFKLLEDYIKTMPKQKTEYGEFKVDMDLFISMLVSDMEKAKAKEKAEKRLLKDFADKICYGIPNSNGYQYTYWKGRALSSIPLPLLQKTVEDVKAKLKEGEVILNTNLKALGVNL